MSITGFNIKVALIVVAVVFLCVFLSGETGMGPYAEFLSLDSLTGADEQTSRQILKVGAVEYATR